MPGEPRRYQAQMIRLLIALFLIPALGCAGDNLPTTESATKTMQTKLQMECSDYLELGPPSHMETYVPDSLTEILIGYGARGEPIDAELAEIGALALMESASLVDVEDREIREYLQQGANLVGRVLEANE